MCLPIQICILLFITVYLWVFFFFFYHFLLYFHCITLVLNWKKHNFGFYIGYKIPYFFKISNRLFKCITVRIAGLGVLEKGEWCRHHTPRHEEVVVCLSVQPWTNCFFSCLRKSATVYFYRLETSFISKVIQDRDNVN